MRTTHTETILRLAKSRPYFSLSDAAEVGTPRVVLTRLVRGGHLERVSRGLYRHSQFPISEHEDLVKVAHHCTQGVFCLHTALRFHGITTRPSFDIWLGLPSQFKLPRINSSRLHVTRFGGATFSEGIEVHLLNGFSIRVYGVAKTLADCFRFRKMIGMDAALEALHNAWIKQNVTMDDLIHYASICGVEKEMAPYLESLIWFRRI